MSTLFIYLLFFKCWRQHK